MATRFIPVSICRVPATINGKHFLDTSDKEVIDNINDLLRNGNVEYRIQPLDVEQIFIDPRQERLAEQFAHMRCPARSPGGVTDDGILPRKGAQCGLPKGHDEEHSVLVPTGAPWAKSAAKARKKSPRQASRARARVARMFKKSNAKNWRAPR